ncbi:hypothetical protein O181_087741, partial [Austropuccinia psidii MF-1]|nr:hypothetical protein [Austropuccinia psidii MF-1]
SNDETATDFDPMADDTDTASMTSPRIPATQFRNRTAFDDGHLPPAHPHRPKRPQTLAAAATVNSTISILQKESNNNHNFKLDGLGYEASLESGIESGASTYDGDVSSAPGTIHKRGQAGNFKISPHLHLHQSDDASDLSRKGSLPSSSLSQMSWAHEPPQTNQSSPSVKTSSITPKSKPLIKTPNLALAPAPHGILSRLDAQDLQAKMKEAIENSSNQRSYPINPPPLDRPIRIYADGVYDLFHYGHALQLRQCKLFFPEVYLMVGVCSDELVRKYKASPVMTSAERYESVSNCKWVDEVIEDAPWQVDAEFLEKYKIDYVAHDEEPYASLDSEDVYAYVKSQGKFLPTRRTDGVSTSELLQRIVGGYLEGTYDNKLEKIGAGDLCSNIALSDGGSGVNRGGTGTRTPMVTHSPKGTIDAEMDDGTATVSEVVN